ncbi:MAG: dihydroneopterin aldolase [Opitutales bacterium]|nr:dihydroneopterin aldolase [Opitutales bacterium]
MIKTDSRLHINGLEFSLNLGYECEERETKQTVVFDIDLCFESLPETCQTDDLNGGICYDALIRNLHSGVADKEWRTLEHLAAGTGNLLNILCPQVCDWHLKVSKLNPPLPFSCKSTAFSISKGGLR